MILRIVTQRYMEVHEDCLDAALEDVQGEDYYGDEAVWVFRTDKDEPLWMHKGSDYGLPTAKNGKGGD